MNYHINMSLNITFQKYPIKIQLILAVIFPVLNVFVSEFNRQVLALPLFMDMIFVYTASFFGIPCGIFTGIASTFFNAVFIQHTFMHVLYAICCVTGTLLTKLFVTRYKDFLWFRLVLLFFVSTVVISFEGSVIYAVFFSETGSNENTTILFLTYNLVLQNIGLQMSAFLARLPVNLFDKAIAVSVGFLIFLGTNRVYNKIEVNKNGRESD